MDAKEWKALLAEPALLNLISALAALDRVYSGINALKISYLGHSVPIGLFSVGFLVGTLGLFMEKSGNADKDTRHIEKVRLVSYIFLALGVLGIMILVSIDAYCAKLLIQKKTGCLCDSAA